MRGDAAEQVAQARVEAETLRLASAAQLRRRLTEAEALVAALVSKGFDTAEIAELLAPMTATSVRAHVHTASVKLGDVAAQLDATVDAEVEGLEELRPMMRVYTWSRRVLGIH